jgi:endo-beta-N-acetylglucosaminidase D
MLNFRRKSFVDQYVTLSACYWNGSFGNGFVTDQSEHVTSFAVRLGVYVGWLGDERNLYSTEKSPGWIHLS